MALPTHLFLRAGPLSRPITPRICLTAILQKDWVPPRTASLVGDARRAFDAVRMEEPATCGDAIPMHGDGASGDQKR